MRTRILLLSMLMTGLTCEVSAQSDNDFGLDFSLKGQHKMLNKRMTLGVEAGYRTQDNTRRPDRVSLGAELSYKLIDKKRWGLKVEGGYTHLWVNKLAECETHYDFYNPVYDDGELDGYEKVDEQDFIGEANGGVKEEDGYNTTSRFWQNRDRGVVSFQLSYKPKKRWSYSWAEGIQYSRYHHTYTSRAKWRQNDDDDWYKKRTEWSDTVKYSKAKDRLVLRSKLGVEYNVKGIPINIFANGEYGCGLNYKANKFKLTGGANYTIMKTHEIELFYRFKTEDDDEEPDGHFIGLGYTFKF